MKKCYCSLVNASCRECALLFNTALEWFRQGILVPCIAVEQTLLKRKRCAKSIEAQTLRIFRNNRFLWNRCHCKILLSVAQHTNQYHVMVVQQLWGTETMPCQILFDPKLVFRRRLCDLPTTFVEQFPLPKSFPGVTIN